MSEQDEQQQRIERRVVFIVDALPVKGGWRKAQTREAYLDLGYELLRLGAGLTEIDHQLRAIYTATAREFRK